MQQPALVATSLAILAALRARGIAPDYVVGRVTDEITLVTNGILLESASADLWQFVDRVEVSLYPGHEMSEKGLSQIQSLLSAHDVKLRVRRPTQFRESYSSTPNEDPELVRRIYTTCLNAHVYGCHQIYDGYFYKCAQAHALALHACKDGKRNPHGDGVRLENRAPDENLLNELAAYLQDRAPLGACKNCLGTVGKLFSHETPGRSGWRAPQEKPVTSLVDEEYLRSLEVIFKSGNFDVAALTRILES